MICGAYCSAASRADATPRNVAQMEICAERREPSGVEPVVKRRKVTKVMKELRQRIPARRSTDTGWRDKCDIHVEENDPGEDYREAPGVTLNLCLDELRRAVVVQNYGYFRILEMWWIVDHVKYQSSGETVRRRLNEFSIRSTHTKVKRSH